MTFADYLLALFYHVDWALGALNLRRIRSRGPAPKLWDSEVITMELAGEFLGIDTDEQIWKYFRRYHGCEFPRLRDTDRSTFVRQSANLWRIKQLLLEHFAQRLPQQEVGCDGPLWLIDSFPLRICRFKRAPSHKLFAGRAAYGKDPTDGGSTGRFYGFKVHLRVSDRGVCTAATIAPANYIDAQLVPELSVADGCGIGDRAYWNPLLQQQLLEGPGFLLLAPFRKESSDPWPERSALLDRLRHVIETSIGQLAIRFHAERTWARDLWHLTVRLGRKLLSHTLAVYLNWREGNPMLQLDRLVTD
jgi:hypothetical protein